ncbi:MAG: HD-GYP domain-containing protein [Candidatus Adiutrix sp.]|jgi:putative nucleotidyltransferase with HDIG domain|nr:HD-GYP domain-containing protein [Candidatus Adiutrix sp.]
MLKKIPTKDLTVGMFVADVGRSWLNHPWKTKSKLLTDYNEIRELLEFGIKEVVIDTDKAQEPKAPEASAAQAAPAVPQRPKPAQASQDLSAAPRPPLGRTSPVRPAQTAPEPVTELEMELPKAVRAYNKALDTSKALVAACRMNKKIEVKAVQENVDELVDSVSRNRDALMALMKLRRFDDYTYTHSLNVSVLAISAGKSLGLSDEDLRALGLGTMFHDLGKTRIPPHILNKPGKLSDDEFAIMRNHAALSGEIIQEQKLQVEEIVFKIARHHHERIDGSGYPDHIQGGAIPDLVTICGMSDVYDALTSDRVYHKGRSPHEALKFIYSLRGTHFQEEWVDRFVQSVGIYPPGTIVQLSSDQIAVVMEINQAALHAPRVKTIADPNGMIYSRPKLLNLSDAKEAAGIVIKKVIPKDEAGFDPAYYFNPPK